MARGKLILIEGLDRTGKTTQTSILLEKLGGDAELIKFPNRTTKTGQLINTYLTDSSFSLPDQAIHLLFSANRWEDAEKIKGLLLEGKHVILDRYVYSGVAYSAAKKTPGMDLEWCLQPDKGLIKPDLTLFFMNEQAETSSRGGFGEERYETSAFQTQVKNEFLQLMNEIEEPHYRKNHLKVLNVAGKTIEEVSEEVWTIVSDNIQKDSYDFMYF